MNTNYDFLYDENKTVTCRHCKWQGVMKQTKGGYVHTPPESWYSLAGREGYEYFCPKCGWMVASHYTRMS